MIRKKIWNIILLLITIATAASVYYFITNYCLHVCTFESKRGYIDPLFSGSLTISASLFLLIFFPPVVFTKWLKQIASWYLPVSLLLVGSISVHDSGIMSIGRGQMMFNLMVILFFVTLIFALMQTFIFRKHN